MTPFNGLKIEPVKRGGIRPPLQENVLEIKRIMFEKFHSGEYGAYRGVARPRSGSAPPYPVPPHLINILSFPLSLFTFFPHSCLAVHRPAFSALHLLYLAACIVHRGREPPSPRRTADAPRRGDRDGRTHAVSNSIMPPRMPGGMAGGCHRQMDARNATGTRDRARPFPDPRKRTAPPFCMDATWMQGIRSPPYESRRISPSAVTLPPIRSPRQPPP